MRELFAKDKNRFKTLHRVSAGDILLDYSKNRIDEKVMAALFDIARKADVEGRRKAMWAGQHINITEDRAVMHMALRYQGDKPVKIDGKDVMPDVRARARRDEGFLRTRCAPARSAARPASSFTDVVNIGIGGSDLGPAMVTLALAPYTRADLRAHYVSAMSTARICTTR